MSLTIDRDEQILKLAAEKKPSRTIAATLGISKSTVNAVVARSRPAKPPVLEAAERETDRPHALAQGAPTPLPPAADVEVFAPVTPDTAPPDHLESTAGRGGDGPTVGPRTVTVGERTYTILYPDLLRPLHPDERERLAASVRTHGVQTPVIVDENNGVIDGANRLTVAAELGLDSVPTRVQPGLSDEEKLVLALELNDARRHLTPADRREAQAAAERLRAGRVARVAEMRREGMSTRTIAKAEGVSQPQVLRDLKAATDTGVSVEPETGRVTGRDGKERPATRPRPVVEDPAPTPDHIAEAVGSPDDRLEDGQPEPVGEDELHLDSGVSRVARDVPRGPARQPGSREEQLAARWTLIAVKAEADHWSRCTSRALNGKADDRAACLHEILAEAEQKVRQWRGEWPQSLREAGEHTP